MTLEHPLQTSSGNCNYNCVSISPCVVAVCCLRVVLLVPTILPPPRWTWILCMLAALTQAQRMTTPTQAQTKTRTGVPACVCDCIPYTAGGLISWFDVKTMKMSPTNISRPRNVRIANIEGVAATTKIRPTNWRTTKI